MNLVINSFLFGSMALAVALLFLVPIRQAPKPPATRLSIFHALFPGLSPAWGWLAGPVLVAWFTLVIRALLVYGPGTDDVIGLIGILNVARTFGVAYTSEEFRESLRPALWLTYGAPAFLTLLNLVLVWRERNRKNNNSAKEVISGN